MVADVDSLAPLASHITQGSISMSRPDYVILSPSLFHVINECHIHTYIRERALCPLSLMVTNPSDLRQNIWRGSARGEQLIVGTLGDTSHYNVLVLLPAASERLSCDCTRRRAHC